MANTIQTRRRLSRGAGVALLAGLVALSACTHGRDWDTYGLTIVTDPPGAECEFERNGVRTQAHARTPVDVVLTTGHGWIQITCSRPGHMPESRYVSGFFEGTVDMTLSPVPQSQGR